jgi:hypothetical protein
MTTFRGPLHIKRAESEVTAVAIEAGGSATFTDSVRIQGSLQVSGDVNVSGAINSGIGAGTYVQSTTVAEGATAGVTAAKIPAGGYLLDMNVWNVGAQTVGTAAATVNLLVGDGTDQDVFATMNNVSGAQFLGLAAMTGVCGRAMGPFAAETNIIVQTTVASGSISAASTGAKLVHTLYRRA